MEYENTYKDKIEERLDKARRRYNFFRLESTFLTVLTIGLAIALITLITGKFIKIPFNAYVALIPFFSIYVFISFVLLFKNWIGKSEAAGLLDKRMHFKERLVTGLEYAEQQNEKNMFLDLLVNDIANKLDDKTIKSTIPHKTPRATKFLVPVAILLLLLLFLPYFYADKSEQIVEDIKETVSKLPELIKKEEKKPEPPVESKDDLLAKKKEEPKQEEPKKDHQEKEQEGQEDKKLADASTTKPEEKQDTSKKQEQIDRQNKQYEQQLQAQAQRDIKNSQSRDKQQQKPANSLQDQISKLVNKINSKLNDLENKPKPGDRTGSTSQKLSGMEKPSREPSRKDTPPSRQTAKTDKQQTQQGKEQKPAKTAGTSTPSKESSEQKKQPPKIPKSKLGQKLAQKLISKKDLEDYSQQNLPMDGIDKDLIDSLKDKLGSSSPQAAGTSGSQSGSNPSQQGSQQSSSNKGTSPPSKSESAGTDSGSSKQEGSSEQSSKMAENTSSFNKTSHSGKQSDSTNAGSDTGMSSGGTQAQPTGKDEARVSSNGTGGTNNQQSEQQGQQRGRQQGGSGTSESKMATGQGGSPETGSDPSQKPQNMDTPSDGGRKGTGQLNDKLAQADRKAGSAGSEPFPSSAKAGKDKIAENRNGSGQPAQSTQTPSSEKDAGLNKGKQMTSASDKSGTDSTPMSASGQMAQKGKGKQEGMQNEAGAQNASGKGSNTEGSKLGDSMAGQQQEGGHQGMSQKGEQVAKAGTPGNEGGKSASNAGMKGREQTGGKGVNGSGKSSADGAGLDSKRAGTSPKKGNEGEGSNQSFKVAQLDKGMQQAGGMPKGKPAGSGGRKGDGKPQSAAELKEEIINRMEGLSNQISDIEKQLGLKVDDKAKMEIEKALQELEESRAGRGTDNGRQRQTADLQDKFEVMSPLPGNKPGEELYSSKPENLELPQNAGDFNLKLEGIMDEKGAERETISRDKGKSSKKRRLPSVGYDESVKLSTRQAEDDVIKKTSIPLEYEDIIKKIHTEKE